MCHVKYTRSEQLTDTAQFDHKRIINPKITHADKIVEAIAECAKTIKEIGNISGSNEMKQFERLATQAFINDARVAAKFLSTPDGMYDT